MAKTSALTRDKNLRLAAAKPARLQREKALQALRADYSLTKILPLG